MIKMSDLVASVTSGLRTKLDCTVEAYHRVEPPGELTVYVQPREQDEERGVGIGNIWARDVELTLIAEIPWDDSVATGAALCAAVEGIEEWVDSNRGLVSGYVLRLGKTTWHYVSRPGVTTGCLAALTQVRVKWPG